MSDMETLEKRFGIPVRARVMAGQSGLACVQITSAAGTGQMYLHGAHVTAWQPNGHKPVIWMSGKSWFEAGKPIRGGVPICFPWFGPNPSDATLPAHGFARLLEWELIEVREVEDGAIAVTMGLKSNEATRKYWPHDFELRHRVSFGRALEMELEIKNTGNAPIHVNEALHTYFAVGDIRQIKVTGCEGLEFIDKVDGKKTKTQAGAIAFAGETDRVYLEAVGQKGKNTIEDSALHRQINVEKTGSVNTVVWNPWIAKAKAMADFGDEEWPGMVCVETGNVSPNGLELGAGAVHKMSARITCTAL